LRGSVINPIGGIALLIRKRRKTSSKAKRRAGSVTASLIDFFVMALRASLII